MKEEEGKFGSLAEEERRKEEELLKRMETLEKEKLEIETDWKDALSKIVDLETVQSFCVQTSALLFCRRECRCMREAKYVDRG